MRRSASFFSPLGLTFALALVIGLGVSMRLRGGLAFSPGALSAVAHAPTPIQGFTSHADFEQECARCHQPLKTPQSALCLGCHTNVNDEINQKTGVHGHGEVQARCAACHPDHRGREFDTAEAALPLFDHTATRFSLVWHQVGYDAAPLTCDGCHIPGSAAYAFNLEACARCHATQDPQFMLQHAADFGLGCLECHDGLDTLARFDHQASAFPLEGGHTALACGECHHKQAAAIQPAAPGKPGVQRVAAQFAGLPTDCAGCHAEPEQHRGLFGQNCQECHSAAAWRPATFDGAPFDHETSTAFSLARHAQDYTGQAIACSGCHTGGAPMTDTTACTACHQDHDPAFMQTHLAQAGPACLECHDGRDRMSGFDHAAVFALDGRHAELTCRECHLDARFDDASSLCVQCHAEPAIHAGFFGLECQRCHTAAAWRPAMLQMHNFPLDHGERGPLECKVCHPAAFTEYTCYGCHEHQPDPIAAEHLEEGISLPELGDCAGCHPSGREEEDE